MLNRLRGYKEIRGNFSSGFTVARAAIPIPIRLQSCAMNSTERAKDMAATNGFDQARINKENDRHNSVRAIGGIGFNWCLDVKYLPAIAVFVLMVSADGQCQFVSLALCDALLGGLSP